MIIVITGVSRGIGLALVKELLLKDHIVTGIVRRPSKELLALKDQYLSLKLIELDLQDLKASETLTKSMADLPQIDLVINNAGVFENGSSKEAFLKSFEVNAFVPYLVAQTLLPKLKKSLNPKLVHITSKMGSITENTSGGSHAYRASKAALNMLHKCLTIENDWLTTAVLHPGWVQTDMGGTSAPISPKASAESMIKVILELEREKSGCFKDYQGRDLPW